MAFTKQVREAKQEITKSESWSAEVGGYDVSVNRDDREFVTIGIWPNQWRGEFGQDTMRLGIVTLHPKHVAELEALAERLPAVLTELAAMMRAEGLEDLRSDFDKRRDEWDEQRRKMLESIRAADAVDPHAASTGTPSTRERSSS